MDIDDIGDGAENEKGNTRERNQRHIADRMDIELIPPFKDGGNVLTVNKYGDKRNKGKDQPFLLFRFALSALVNEISQKIRKDDEKGQEDQGFSAIVSEDP